MPTIRDNNSDNNTDDVLASLIVDDVESEGTDTLTEEHLHDAIDLLRDASARGRSAQYQMSNTGWVEMPVPMSDIEPLTFNMPDMRNHGAYGAVDLGHTHSIEVPTNEYHWQLMDIDPQTGNRHVVDIWADSEDDLNRRVRDAERRARDHEAEYHLRRQRETPQQRDERRAQEHYEQRQEGRRRRERDEAHRQRERERRGLADEIIRQNQSRPPDRQFNYMCEDCHGGIMGDGHNDYRYAHNHRMICMSCINNYYVPCNSCQEQTRRNGASQDFRGNILCSNCRSGYEVCYSCEHLVRRTELIHDGEDNEDYCPSCHSQLINERNNNNMNPEEDIEFNDDDYEDDDDYIDEDSPIWRRYQTRKLKKFCSEDEGAIIKNSRIFSAELETKFPDARTFNRAMRTKLPEELGAEYDGSISSQGAEFQTPKLQGKNGENFIKDVCKVLNEEGFKTDRTCGLHIHLDGGEDFVPMDGSDTRNHEGNNLKLLFLFYLVYEDVIHSFLPSSRRSNRFCKPIKENYHISEIMNTMSIDEIEKIWYRTGNRSSVEACKREKKNGTRYCGVNFHTLISENHLEIRYHSGTINATKILEWANLHGLIMDQIAEGNITFNAITDAQQILDLKEKTEMFFNLVGLTDSSRRYFAKRQEKFLVKSDRAEEEFKDAEVTALQDN